MPDKDYEPNGPPASLRDMYAGGWDFLASIGLFVDPIIRGAFRANHKYHENISKAKDLPSYADEADKEAKKAIKEAKSQDDKDFEKFVRAYNIEKMELEIKTGKKSYRLMGKEGYYGDGKINVIFPGMINSNIVQGDEGSIESQGNLASPFSRYRKYSSGSSILNPGAAG
jgi:hypothetical protein